MLIPRFSLRWLLGAMTVFGVISLVLSLAVRGHAWAVAATLALTSLALAFWIYGAVFLATYVFTILFIVLRKAFARERTTAPFAQFTPAPQQVVGPEDLE